MEPHPIPKPPRFYPVPGCSVVTRKDFRFASNRARLHIVYCGADESFWLTELERIAASYLRKTFQTTDLLVARESSLTPSFKLRVALYPLLPKERAT